MLNVCLYFLIRCVPVDEAIDLLNVAFEQKPSSGKVNSSTRYQITTVLRFESFLIVFMGF